MSRHRQLSGDVPAVVLSKRVAHALRHAPWLYELELDPEGWVPVEQLLAALRTSGPAWRNLGPGDLARMVEGSSKRRFELTGGRIRALYGHSVPGRIARTPAQPPDLLFHGTAAASVPAILEAGLRSMRRQYVHLSVDELTARQVGQRKSRRPVVLRVHAGAAHAAGVAFFRGNEAVWLADHVPPGFLTR